MGCGSECSFLYDDLQTVGCDGRLGNSVQIVKTLDTCGICGGDGTSCATSVFQWQQLDGDCHPACGTNRECGQQSVIFTTVQRTPPRARSLREHGEWRDGGRGTVRESNTTALDQCQVRRSHLSGRVSCAALNGGYQLHLIAAPLFTSRKRALP